MSRSRDSHTPVAIEIPFDNEDTLFTADNVEDALKQVSEVVEGNFNFSNAVNFEVFTSLGTDSTTSTTYQTKLTGTTSEPGSGKYVINWYAELTNTGNNKLNEYRVQFKRTSDATWIDACELEVLVARAEAWEIMSGFRVFEIMVDDTIDFRVQYRRINATARIRNSNLYIFRVATT